jgi:hypothetical protein
VGQLRLGLGQVLDYADQIMRAGRNVQAILFIEREASDVTVGADLVAALVDVFSSWQDLAKKEKRELLRSYRMRVVVIRPRRGELKVERVEIGALPSSPDELCLYK